MIYDQELLLDELEISKEEKKRIISELKRDFPDDEMLFEIHLFRVVQYLKKKRSKN